MSGVAIKYGDVAPEAKENFVPTASEAAGFVNLSQLQQYNLHFANYANPCELYQTLLDGNAVAFPLEPDGAVLGLWSEQVSGDDGTFSSPISLMLVSEGQYSSQGLTLTFDKYNGIYCTSLNIKWYRDLEIISEMDYNPDSAFYFCRNQVENYNRVRITFYSMNMPQNRLKLCAVDYGYGTYFYGNELRNVKLIQEINPISSEIAINTCDFTLDSKSDMNYSFQSKQPLNIFFNDRLLATCFVKTSKRTAKRLWTVKSEDYIGLMDSIPFYGGMYNSKDAIELLVEIFTTAKIPYNIEEVFDGITVTGYIPLCTCREALMQVAFAIGAVVDTSNSEKVEIYALCDDKMQTIPLKRIKQGQNFEDEDTVTGVEVVMHTYKAISDSTTLYEASESGTGDNILVGFSEPIHTLSISSGQIVTSGTNYAVINAKTGCTLSGKRYEHTTVAKRRNNPVVLASEIEKIIAVESATLVSNSNIDEVLDRCYEYLTINKQINLEIVEGKHIINGIVTYDQAVNVGEVIESETEYLGVISGRIIRQTFDLNSGIILKDVNMR